MKISDEWRKSTKCGSAPDCVEVKRYGTSIQVRDSKRADDTHAVLTFTESEWAAFAAGMRAGEFEL